MTPMRARSGMTVLFLAGVVMTAVVPCFAFAICAVAVALIVAPDSVPSLHPAPLATRLQPVACSTFRHGRAPPSRPV
jgi:hypothetical protein